METMNTLNTTDEWERIVNANALQKASARERVAARKRDRKTRKLLKVTFALCIGGIVTVILGCAGALAAWLTVSIAVVCLLASNHLLGRYLEAKKS